MADEKRKGGGGKLARSGQVTVRLDPKLRMAAELAAAKERRTLSSFVEWAIQEQIRNVWVAYGKDGHAVSAETVVQDVWNIVDTDRFLNVAIRYSLLLTSQEQVLWKVIRAYTSDGLDDENNYQQEYQKNGEQGIRQRIDLNKIRKK